MDVGEYLRQLMANATIAVHEEHELKGSVDPRTVFGVMAFRDAKLVYRSPIQQRDFKYPYQLGNSEISDGPNMTMKLFVRVEAGDIVVLGTDGCLIAWYALHNSFDRFAFSPFEKAAKKAGLNRMGGKVDDITVVVRIVQS
ncbi:hypothetical protein QQP08_005198 [Theobroma cacao]|nr:hypothetical protein QQP08_005198 [Theobroma cacao]